MAGNNYIKLKFCVFLVMFFIGGNLHSQDPDKKKDDFLIENSETVSPFEVPSDSKFSPKTQSRYTDLISKLYNDRNAVNKKLSEYKSQKKSELNKAGSKDITLLNTLTSNISENEKNYASLQVDIDKLTKEFKESKNDREAIKAISSIEFDRYKIVAEEDEVDNSWEEEFEYLDKKKDKKTKSGVKDECKIVFNGVDPSSLKQKIQTSSENLIAYTHPKLEAFYKDQSFLTGDVSLIEIGGDKYMTLNIIVRSRDALKNYGMIQIGTPLKMELINGESAYLFSATDAVGRPIAQTNNINYQALYVINKSEYKLLKKSEIDNIGIMWSSGYEKYDVYNVDVVQKQITCLEKF